MHEVELAKTLMTGELVVRGELSLLSARLRQEVPKVGEGQAVRPIDDTDPLQVLFRKKPHGALSSPAQPFGAKVATQDAAHLDHGSLRLDDRFARREGEVLPADDAPKPADILPALRYGEFLAHVALARVTAHATGGANALDARPGRAVVRVTAADDLKPSLRNEVVSEERDAPNEKMKMRRAAFLRFELPNGGRGGSGAAEPFPEGVQIALPPTGFTRPGARLSEGDEEGGRIAPNLRAKLHHARACLTRETADLAALGVVLPLVGLPARQSADTYQRAFKVKLDATVRFPVGFPGEFAGLGLLFQFRRMNGEEGVKLRGVEFPHGEIWPLDKPRGRAPARLAPLPATGPCRPEGPKLRASARNPSDHCAPPFALSLRTMARMAARNGSASPGHASPISATSSLSREFCVSPCVSPPCSPHVSSLSSQVSNPVPRTIRRFVTRRASECRSVLKPCIYQASRFVASSVSCQAMTAQDAPHLNFVCLFVCCSPRSREVLHPALVWSSTESM